MAGFEPFKDVYDSLTKPIREHPISSLFFFVGLLVAGYFGQKYLQIPDQYRSVVQPLLIAVPSAGVVLCLHRLLVMRNDPSRLTDTSVLENIKHSFVGRDDDADDLTALILSPATYQVWLNGDSGVGKSLLLQKAVLPRLADRKVETIYLNSWRGDWQSAPAAAILAQLNDSATGDLFFRLTRVLASPPVRVIILDQFDEFQIEHRDKFIPERGLVIKRDQLEAGNRFFSILNAAVREHRVRCVFVSRLDVDWVKRTVLLENEAEEKILTRLQRNVVVGAIAAVVPADKVERPENGWDELRQRLCDDLAEYGVLPIQMRFAVLGLAELRNHLTVSAYVRIGGVSGLVSRYVEGEVRRVAAGGSMATTLFSLLDRLVTLEGNATASVPHEELLKAVAKRDREEVLKALEALKGRDIVRTVSNQDGTLLWRLDHDYLAAPVRAISRRQLPEQWELKDRLQQYEATPPWQRPFKLAGPITLARLTRAKLFKGLRLDSAATWLLHSVAAFLLLLAGLAYAASGGYQWFADRAWGSRLFNASGGYELSQAGVLALSRSRIATRKTFLETALASDANVERLNKHLFPLAIALSQVNPSEADELYQSVIAPAITPSRAGQQQTLIGGLRLMLFWDSASSLNSNESRQVATILVERMIKETDELRSTPNEVLDELSVLTKKLDRATAQKLATTLVERMSNEGDTYALRALAQGLGVLKDKADQQTIQKAATTLVGLMSNETSGYSYRALVEGLVALEDKVEPKTIEKAATILVERMSQENFADDSCASAFRLYELKDKVERQTLQQAATTLVEQMTNPAARSDRLGQLAACLAWFTDDIDLPTAQQLATRLVEQMSRESTPYGLEGLANGLGALEDKVEPQTIEKAVTILVEAMGTQGDEKAPGELGSGLHALTDTIDQETAQWLAVLLVERMSKGKNSTVLQVLASELASLTAKIDQPTAQNLASTPQPVNVSRRR